MKTLAIVVALALHSLAQISAVEAIHGGDTSLLFLWKSNGNEGWVQLNEKSKMVSCRFVVEGKVITTHSIEDVDEPKLMVEINLSPINIRIANTNFGSSVRIERSGKVVALREVNHRLFGEERDQTYFIVSPVSVRAVTDRLESDGVPDLNQVLKWIERGDLAVDKVAVNPAGQILP